MAENLELTVSTEGMDTKNIENNLLQEKKISEESVENSLNYDSLSTEEKQAIDEFVKKIDVGNTNQVLQYGASAQNKIAKFSDSVLDSVLYSV